MFVESDLATQLNVPDISERIGRKEIKIKHLRLAEVVYNFFDYNIIEDGKNLGRKILYVQ